MSTDNVLKKLKSMGITPDVYPTVSEILDIIYSEQEKILLNLIRYLPTEPVPGGAVHIVEDWTAGHIILNLRVSNPQLCTFVKYISNGRSTRQYALLDGSKQMDPVSRLLEIPWPEIYQYRRLVPKLR